MTAGAYDNGGGFFGESGDFVGEFRRLFSKVGNLMLIEWLFWGSQFSFSSDLT